MCKVVRTEQNRREEKRTKQSRVEDKVQVVVVERRAESQQLRETMDWTF